MAVSLRYGHLCDHVTIDAAGKISCIGIFDVLNVPPDAHGILPVPFAVVARVECSGADGTEHSVRLSFADDDEAPLAVVVDTGTVTFQSSGPGRGFSHAVIARGMALPIPKKGDGKVVVEVDGKRAGEIPYYVNARIG